MLRKTSIIFIQLITVLLIPMQLSAQDKTPHEIIEQTSAAALTALSNESNELKANPNKINDLVDEIILPICDLDRMGKYILAKHWKTASDHQRVAFVTEFKQMLIRNYGKHLAEYPNAKITVLPYKHTKEKLYQTVSTKLDTGIGSKPFQVDYVFRVSDESTKVVDVRVEGVSILKTFRTAFAQEIAETSLVALIERITLLNQPALAMNSVP